MITQVSTGPPTITIHPISQLINVSMSVVLNCEGTSRGSIMYQWQTYNKRRQWYNIRSNANGKIFTKCNLQESQQYRCIASNKAGSTISNKANVTVLSKLFLCYINWYICFNRNH